jgi:hypothetical protein
VDHPEYFLPYVGLWQGSYISRTVTLSDRQAAFHAAEENTEAFLATQIEEITAHMSGSVLADRVSGPSLLPGGPISPFGIVAVLKAS